MAITIVRSSAGAGKTFRLTLEFLQLLIENPYQYRNILAITFTKKSTAEMKRRILKELSDLAEGTSKMNEELTENLSLSEAEIQKKATFALQLILHHYTDFNVRTIDSFVSSLVRNTAQEIGIPVSYKIEMDTDYVLQELLHRLFSSIQDQPEVKVWLLDFINQQVLQDKSARIEHHIGKFSIEIFSEQFWDTIRNSSKNIVDFKVLKEQLFKAQKQHISLIKSYGKQMELVLENNHLKVVDLSSHPKGVVQKMITGDLDKLFDAATLFGLGERTKTWFTKVSKLNEQNDTLCEQLYNIVDTVIEALAPIKRNYFTQKALLQNIHTWGIIREIYDHLRSIRKQQNFLLIGDQAMILNEVIERSDAPLIYEKMSGRLQHIMIDEFQDTSDSQWQTMLPFVTNIAATGGETVLVGDVKQSIYRWRGGNMNLLLNDVEKDIINFGIHEDFLKFNWRSNTQIVSFNNLFFDIVKQNISFINPSVKGTELLSEAYKNHEQIPKKEDDGIVQLRGIDFGDKELVYDQLISDIRMIHEEHHYPLNDILVLLDSNKDAIEVAQHLLRNGIPVVTPASFLLKENPLVQLLIYTLEYIRQPDNKVLLHNASFLYKKHVLNKQIDWHEFYTSTPDLFNEILPQNILNHTAQLRKENIVSLVLGLISDYQIDSLQDIFLQHFIDRIIDLANQKCTLIDDFLNWWQLHCNHESIPPLEQSNAVEIMTIHKSKGLEREFVLLPFGNLNLKPKGIFWTKEVPEKYLDFAPIPLNYNANLANSDFEQAFDIETLEAFVERINVLYVAFTRAKLGLFIYYNEKNKPKEDIWNFSELVHYVIEHESFKFSTSKQEDGLITLGEITLKDQNNKEDSVSTLLQQTNILLAQTRKQMDIRHSQKRDNKSLYYDSNQLRQEGVVMHKVFELYRPSVSVKEAAVLAIQNLQLDDQILDEICFKAERILEHPLLQILKEEDYEVISEKAIAYKGKQYLPDKLLLHENLITVIDFKRKKQTESHIEQIDTYAHILAEMGFTIAHKLLVYIETEEIVAL